MLARVSRSILYDARHAQIVALASLLAINFLAIDFGATVLASAVALASALATQALASRWFGITFEWRSPTITGLSLSLLLRADATWLYALAGAIAILSKFGLRIGGRHIFNPAGFAIVALLVARAPVWISPGQWGAELWFAALSLLLATLVLPAARRVDIAIYFLACHAALLLARALWLGDPLAIPLHQLQSGSLLIFAFFMISDPRTSPTAPFGRFAFALVVAATAHYLAFYEQARPALYFALIALSPLTLLIDIAFPAPSFEWRLPKPEGASA